MSTIVVLYDGYCRISGENEMVANCSCTLVKSSKNVIIDTMTSWDADKILNALQEHGITQQDIHYVVSTHGHSDHIGNNNLFLKAKHIVGFNVSFQDTYYLYPFDKGVQYNIDENVKVIPTPGHTLSDVSVIIKGMNGVVGVTGDLFECLEDIVNPKLWIEAGSEDPVQQRHNRLKVANEVDWIVPGHGPMFKVTEEIRLTLKKQLEH